MLPIRGILCLESLNSVTDGCGTYGGVVYNQCRMYGWFSLDASTWKTGFIGHKSFHKSIIEEVQQKPRKSLKSSEDVIGPRFHVKDPSDIKKGTSSPSSYSSKHLDRRVDIATLWITLEAEGRTRYGAVWAELWRQPRRNKGCMDPTTWEMRTTPNVDPSPELQLIIARINSYYAQARGPQVPLALGSWAVYSANYPKNVRPSQFNFNGLFSLQARTIVGLYLQTVVSASDPSLVIPAGSTDLIHAPNHASDIAFAIWKAKCINKGGFNPSILKFVIMDDVLESTTVQILEYTFGSIGFYTASGQPNLAFLNKDTAAFYVLSATPILVGMNYMLENYALDLGGYVLGVGITWNSTPPDPVQHPTGRKYYVWLQIFHV